MYLSRSQLCLSIREVEVEVGVGVDVRSGCVVVHTANLRHVQGQCV